ncbi:hypothetical protein GCM10022403_042070 [Streptomyces coacervatus]|uniref:Uncharacterized protein n=1 Tax=Streptomyces coacervatus TaxID=647381 RepID=A0ABP7HW46_9ACTN|nr:hypothetical protein [Streptomyces coacervatus]MDF2267207.1 hypothetical protein [Streptomyces coacervatus]
MRKTRKTAVLAVLLGTVGLLGAGTAQAHDHGHGKHHGRAPKTIVINQSTSCKTADNNSDVQGESAYGNGWDGPNSEGTYGPQSTNIGSRLGCDNNLVLGK